MADRLMPYLECDPELSDREYAAIGAHLASCPRCAEEYERLSEGWDALAQVLYPGDALPHIDCEALARAVVAKVAKSEGTTHICAFPPPKRLGRLRLSAVGLAAAAMALIVVAPVLGYTVYRAVSDGREDNTQSRSTDSVSSAPIVLSKASHLGVPDNGLSPERSSGDTSATAPEGSDGLMQSLDHATEAAIIRAQVEAMLPHTDEEYEAWARKEYPHIMWLYDVLMGKIPEKPADSPAGRMVRFAVDQDGNPTITLPDANGHPETFTFPMPPGHTPGEPLWHGTPVNIPEWAEKLYANSPEQDRPTGWRALLIYSGEILKFDWPTTQTAPSVLPTKEATEEVLQIAVDGTFHPLVASVPFAKISNGYLDLLVDNIPLAQSTLTYLATANRLAGTPPFANLATTAEQALADLSSVRSTGCNVRTRSEMLNQLFSSRERDLELLTDCSSGTRY